MSHAERDALIGRLRKVGYSIITTQPFGRSWVATLRRHNENDIPGGIVDCFGPSRDAAIDAVLSEVLRLAAACNGEEITG